MSCSIGRRWRPLAWPANILRSFSDWRTNLGASRQGTRANLVLVDDDFKVQRTWVEGNATASNAGA